jgi:hypothetical protein
LTILDGFPKEARTFKDFPTGVATVFTPNENRIVDISDRKTLLFYQIDLARPRDRRDISNVNMVAAIGTAMDQYAKELYPDEVVLVHGLQSLTWTIEWLVNPAAVKGTFGTPSLIHACSSAGDGFNNFELYFPRGITFRMVGNWGPESKSVLPIDDQHFTGSVMFANRPYHFRLRPMEATLWNTRRFAGKDAKRSDWVVHHINQPMSKDDAAREMRAYIEAYFPFVKEYNMLGEFVFD